MNLGIFRTYSFNTELTAEQAIATLHAAIGPGSEPVIIVEPFNSATSIDVERNAFFGRPLADGAEISRNLNDTPGELRRRNALNPVMDVRVRPGPRGALVDVFCHPPALPLTFMGLWSAFGLFITFGLAVSVLREGTELWAPLYGLGVIGLGWLIVWVAFAEEADSAERILKALIERP